MSFYRQNEEPPLDPFTLSRCADVRGVALATPGGDRYATNVSATSTQEAADQAIAWFLDPFWKSSKPAADTVLEIAPMGVRRTFRVLAYPR